MPKPHQHTPLRANSPPLRNSSTGGKRFQKWAQTQPVAQPEPSLESPPWPSPAQLVVQLGRFFDAPPVGPLGWGELGGLKLSRGSAEGLHQLSTGLHKGGGPLEHQRISEELLRSNRCGMALVRAGLNGRGGSDTYLDLRNVDE